MKRDGKALSAGLPAAACACCIALLAPLRGQIVPPGPVQPGPPGYHGIPGQDEQAAELRELQAKQEALRNQDRQRQLVNDTDKLLRLAEELNAQVDKSGQQQLSAQQAKMTGDIEKLAKSVASKMRGY